jgi:hypothetical protein
MATKPRFRVRSVALATLATAIVMLATASPTLAATGGVYFDADNNAAAGNPSHLFNATFTGYDNVGLGESVMPSLANGIDDVAIGAFALQDVTDGSRNVASGSFALNHDTGGFFNVASGYEALFKNTKGGDNTALGFGALSANKTGDRNVAIGSRAGQNLTKTSDNVDIANPGVAGESGAIRIGTDGDQTRAFLAGVTGKSIPGPAQPVLVNAQGQLGTATAASAASSAKAPSADRQLRAKLNRLQRAVRQLRTEVKRGR